MSAESPVVLVVGAASRDVAEEEARGWRLGGAVTFASLALARLGLEVWALVGADEEAARADELDILRAAGVTLAVAELESGPVFDNVSHMLHSASDLVPISALPRRWTSGFDGLLLVPVAAEIGDEWASLAAGDPPPTVGLGWQGLMRHLQPGELVSPRPPVSSPVVRAASLVVMSREDVVAGTGPEDLLPLLGPGATLAWTEGVEGGILLEQGTGHVATPSATPGAAGIRRYPAIPSDAIVDPTGAGDVFLAGMLAASLRPSLGEPTLVAAAAASLTVEGPGLIGVPDLAAVRRRMTRAPSLASLRPSAVSSRESGRPSQA